MMHLRARVVRIERRLVDLRNAGIDRPSIDLRRLTSEELARLKAFRARALLHGHEGQPDWSVLMGDELMEIRRLFDIARRAIHPILGVVTSVAM